MDLASHRVGLSVVPFLVSQDRSAVRMRIFSHCRTYVLESPQDGKAPDDKTRNLRIVIYYSWASSLAKSSKNCVICSDRPVRCASPMETRRMQMIIVRIVINIKTADHQKEANKQYVVFIR